ncbi:SEL1 [Lepeophtheirus salmonis]|uniref:SEL1 n=1 Tax=Lepeophtheirus salmonis TaxID=72036 RepID=A0A7R8GYL5_LEPSM|nr:SEL1 [Lepeophtheirus salmonis]CAF2749945.1 SEL1 [Lepeophtheirus salmonis]
MVFNHNLGGIVHNSSPAPIRRGNGHFGFDPSISSPLDVKRALFDNSNNHGSSLPKKPKTSEDDEEIAEYPSKTVTSSSLVCNFEESVLNGRIYPVSQVDGFIAKIGASGSFHPRHLTLPVTVYYYSLCDNLKVSSPYMGHIDIGKKGYRVPDKGTIQVTLFNPLGTVVKIQRTLYMPSDLPIDATDSEPHKWLRYVIHLRFASSKSGKIYLHTDIRMIIFNKSDLDTATDFLGRFHEERGKLEDLSSDRVIEYFLKWSQLAATLAHFVRELGPNSWGSSMKKNWDPFPIFQDLASTVGDPDAQFSLGFLYATGLTINSSQAKAMLYYSFAANGASPLALMALGYRHLSGIGVPSSCETSLIYYRKVAESVVKSVNFSSGTLLQRIRLLDEESESGNGFLDSDKIDYYQFLADNGDVQVQVGLGTLYYQGGRGMDKDHSLALKYFKRGADAGNPVAMAYLGKLYLEGEVVEQSNETALLYFSKSAEALNPIGQTGMGIKQQSKTGSRDNSNWEISFIRDLVLNKIIKTAMKYFFLASQSGHILAYYNLAEMYASGIGTLRSCSISVELYKNVAERGKWASFMMSAHTNYKEGKYDQAILKYLLLAEAGSEVAQANVAYILDRKESNLFESNEMLKRALVYWSRSAAQGYSAARTLKQLHFTIALLRNKVTRKQCFNLGYMHELGVGMKKDIHLAKRFYDMASESSSDAIVPVSIALAKLSFVYTFSKWMEYNDGLLTPIILQFWDLYLLVVLFLLLGIIFLLRKNTH